MIIIEKGIAREATPEEIAEAQRADDLYYKEYWTNTPYEEAIDAEIRKKYSLSNELAILRQKDTKPEEYNEYFNYCEECKSYVKIQRMLYIEE